MKKTTDNSLSGFSDLLAAQIRLNASMIKRLDALELKAAGKPDEKAE
jgi:hypothetical protein